jgi:hypothetical protein
MEVSVMQGWVSSGKSAPGRLELVAAVAGLAISLRICLT